MEINTHKTKVNAYKYLGLTINNRGTIKHEINDNILAVNKKCIKSLLVISYIKEINHFNFNCFITWMYMSNINI